MVKLRTLRNFLLSICYKIFNLIVDKEEVKKTNEVWNKIF